MYYYYVIDCFGQPIGLIGTAKVLHHKCKDLEKDQYGLIPLHTLLFDQEWLRKKERKEGRDN